MTFEPRSMLNHLIASAMDDPYSRAKASFENFHAFGVTYLNLLRTPELTVKLYVFEHNFQSNEHGWVVDPHDHMYGFDTFILHGEVRNLIFVEALCGGWNKFQYASPLRGGGGFSSAIDRVSLVDCSARRYNRGDHYWSTHDTIHTIQVPEKSSTVLMLLQYRDVPLKTTTVLYNTDTAGRPPCTEDLYTPMHEETYLKHLFDVSQLLGVR